MRLASRTATAGVRSQWTPHHMHAVSLLCLEGIQACNLCAQIPPNNSLERLNSISTEAAGSLFIRGFLKG